MKGLFANHWEKLILMLTLGFLAWTWMEAGALEDAVNSSVSKYEKTKNDVDAMTKQPINAPPLDKPGIDQEVENYYSTAKGGDYLLPTSPSAGFETLPTVIVQELKDKTVTLRFVDEELRKRFSNLMDSDKISLKIAPEGIVDFKAVGRTQVKFSGLKHGKATFTIKDKALNGAQFEIVVNQSLKFYAHCDRTSLKAAANPDNLNEIALRWSLVSFSHSDAKLGGVTGYTLKRSVNGGAFQPLKVWTEGSFPTSFKDTDIKLGHSYKYTMTANLWLKTNINQEKIFQQNTNWSHSEADKAVWQVTDRNVGEAVDFEETPAIKINDGIAIVGFTDVSDPGEDGPAKNKIARLVLKKWYRPDPKVKGRWVASWVTLPRLNKNVFSKSDFDKLMATGSIVGIEKNHKVKIDANGPRKPIVFKTGMYLHMIKIFPAGTEVPNALLLPNRMIDEELARFTTNKDGKKVLNELTWAFYVCDKDFKNPKTYLSQAVYGRVLQRVPQKMNLGEKSAPAPKPAPTPEDRPDNPGGTGDNGKD